MTLYELTDEFKRLYEYAEDDDHDAFNDTLEALEGEFETKVDSYVAVIRSLEADAEVLANEINRLQARKRAIKENQNKIYERMQNAMDALGLTKIKTALNTVSIQKNGGKLPLILDVLPDDLPDSLVRIERKPDMEAIRGYLEDGGEGVAHFGERGRSLRIR